MAWWSEDGATAAVRLSSADTRPGTERRGTTGCSCRACKGGREGEKKGVGSVDDAFYRCGGRQGKERGGVRGGVCMEERDKRRDRGPSAAVASSPCPTGVGGPHMHGAALSRGGGVADPWAQGHSSGRRGLNRFKFKRIQTTSKPSKL
jgi:hypothetical protein